MASLFDRKVTKNNYAQPLPAPHPAVEKYHFSLGDVHREAMTLGVAPPTLFGILIGRIRSNDAIDKLLVDMLAPEDIRQLRKDYDPLRHYQFLDIDETDDAFVVQQGYPVGMISQGDAVRTDDGRWLVVSGVEKSEHRIRIFSRGILVVSLSKDVLLTVAINKRISQPRNIAPLHRRDNAGNRERNARFFGEIEPGNFDYHSLYERIKSTVETDDIEGI